jgi:type IX secretion system PorP/SprF family membrane protein
MKRIIATLVILAQLLIFSHVNAQIDPHFSQYYANPLWLNPALTGVMNGETRVNANFRDQYATISNAYQTAAISADFRPTDKLGIGLNILDQSAGSAGYNYLTAYGNLGYGFPISNDGNQIIRFGLDAGFINRSFDPSKLQLGDQFNPISGFDNGIPSGETFSTTHATVFDAGAGVFYYNGDPLASANPFLGFSLNHLTQPKDPFAEEEGINTHLPMRYTVHGGISLKIDESFDLIPHAIFIKQQAAEEKDLGLYSNFKLLNNNGLILGAMYRFGDSAIANVGYEFSNCVVGASYDFNTSSLNSATSGQGGFELSISYVFHKRIQEPEPICPRL